MVFTWSLCDHSIKPLLSLTWNSRLLIIASIVNQFVQMKVFTLEDLYDFVGSLFTICLVSLAVRAFVLEQT